MSTIIIGIGCDRAQNLPAEVLRFSIEHSTHIRLSIIKLHETRQWAELGLQLRSFQRTPFSLQRFFLAKQVIDRSAEVGIYVDSDMLVLRPIEQLVDSLRATGCHVATVAPRSEWRRRPQSSVMVMDRTGAELLWESYQCFVRNEITYDELIYLRTLPAVGSIDYAWNCLEYLDENTALLHWTDVDTQPWLRDGNPNAGIWYTYLWRFAQTNAGQQIAKAEIDAGHVRPALKEVLTHGPSLSSFSTRSRLKDIFFVPPHRFRRVRGRSLRLGLAPLLRMIISLQFIYSNGQLNVR